MKRKFLLASMVLLMPVAAFANLGDTPEQSTARYGAEPITVNHHSRSWQTSGWIVTEWFGPAGKAEIIWCTKYEDQTPTNKQIADAINSNTPRHYHSGQQWILDQNYANPANIVRSYLWRSTDVNYYYGVGFDTTKVDRHYAWFIQVSTAYGRIYGFDEVIQDESPNPQPTPNQQPSTIDNSNGNDVPV
jgi:hypothetical protein